MRIHRLSSSVPPTGRVVVAAVDLSRASEPVFEAAVHVAHGEPDTTIHLLHVRRPAEPTTPSDAEGALAAWVSRLPDGGARLALHAVTSSDVADAIVRTAARLDADVVLVGTHGRTGVARALRGSVAETVVRTASCTVRVVRRKRGA